MLFGLLCSLNFALFGILCCLIFFIFLSMYYSTQKNEKNCIVSCSLLKPLNEEE